MPVAYNLKNKAGRLTFVRRWQPVFRNLEIKNRTPKVQGTWKVVPPRGLQPVHVGTTVPSHTKLNKSTPVGFEPTRGDPIGLAGRRLNRSAKVSLRAFACSSRLVAARRHKRWKRCKFGCAPMQTSRGQHIRKPKRSMILLEILQGLLPDAERHHVSARLSGVDRTVSRRSYPT